MNVGQTRGVFGWGGSALCAGMLVLMNPVIRETLWAQDMAAVAHTGNVDAHAAEALFARPVTLTLTNVSLTRAIDSLARVANVVVQYQLPVLRAYTRLVSIRAVHDPLGIVLERVLNGTLLRASPDGLGNLVLVSVPNAVSDSVPAVGVVSGRIVDSATGAGLHGVMIKIMGTKVSAMTQDSGRFTLRNVPVGQHLLSIKTFGYRPAERTAEVTAGQVTTIRVQLASVSTVLSGVVTTATGIQRKLEVGNDITTLDVDSIRQTAPITSVTDLLESRVPGLTLVHSSGTPGDPAHDGARTTRVYRVSNSQRMPQRSGRSRTYRHAVAIGHHGVRTGA